MKPKNKPESPDLFRSRLDQILNRKHPLFILAGQINWQMLTDAYADLYDPTTGRPAKSIRLLAGLHYLKHAYNLGDETVLAVCGYNVRKLLQNIFKPLLHRLKIMLLSKILQLKGKTIQFAIRESFAMRC